jgi:hypothetical protein
MKRFGLRVLALVVAFLLLSAVPASAKRQSAAARLRHSIAATRDEGSARVEGSMTFKVGDQELKFQIDGVSDLGPLGNGRITMKGDRLPFEFEMRSVDGVLFANVGSLLALAGDRLPRELRGKSWVRMDLRDLSAAAEEGAAPTGSSTDPSGQLDMLRGVAKGSVDTVGRDTVRGVETTHYHAVVDMQKAAAKVPEKFKERFNLSTQLFDKLKDAPVDVWLDDQDRVRRMRMTFGSDIKGQSLDGTVDMDIFDFGVPVSVEAPSADAVIDFTDFMDFVRSEAA